MAKNQSKATVLFVSVVMLFANPSVFAAGGRQSGSPTYQTTVDSNATNSGVAKQQNNQNSNMQNQANQASGKQGMGAMIGAASAGFCAAKAVACCSATPACSACPLWIMGAVASGAVAMAMSGAKGKSDQSANDVTVNPNGTDLNPNNPDPEIEREIDRTQTQVNRATSKIPGLSASVRKGVVKLPDGRVIKASDLSSQQSALAAGLSPSEFSEFQKAMRAGMTEGEKLAKGMDANIDGGEGDALGAGGSPGATTASVDVIGGSGRGLGGASRDPAQVAGLSRNYNGDAIGVAGENLFTLVTRRIDLHEQKDQFIAPK